MATAKAKSTKKGSKPSKPAAKAKAPAKAVSKKLKAAPAASGKKSASSKPAKPSKVQKLRATPAPKAVEKTAAPKGASKVAAAPVKSAPVVNTTAQAGFSLPKGRSGSSRAINSDSVCREIACESLATSAGYCRMHYVKNWKKIKRKELILKEGRLNQYIEELVAKYPDKYIEAIQADLASEKDFSKVIVDLDLDEGVDEFEGDGESVEGVIDSIRRDFDDEGDGF